MREFSMKDLVLGVRATKCAKVMKVKEGNQSLKAEREQGLAEGGTANL